jgi:hypothetical protein
VTEPVSAAAGPSPAPPSPATRLTHAIVMALAGAVAGALALLAAYALRGGFVATLGTTPEVVRGLYPTEFEAGGLPFAWTRDRVTLVFEGLDRSAPWTLAVRTRAGRGPGLPPPSVRVEVDGALRTTQAIGDAWQDVQVEVPAAPSGRARVTRITLDVAPTFVPGPGDTRSLGLIVGGIRLTPSSRFPIAPRRALIAAAVAGAAVGATLAAIGVPLWGAIALTLAFVLAQAIALAIGGAPYSRAYLDRLPDVAAGLGLATALLTNAVALVRRRAPAPWTVAAIGVAFVGVLIELAGLLHPSKPIVDALFHAHRLQWVLEGRYFFTQPMPSGVEFPYAIGLYVTAVPWAGLVRDHVFLLRLVVAIVHGLAALSLYPLVVRNWDDRTAGVLAVAAYLLVPLPFLVIGNANLTYAFGQSIATIAIAAAATWPIGWRAPLPLAGLTALLTLGLLSHVGLIALLGALVVASGLLIAWRGVGVDRQAGLAMVAASAVAAVLAVGLYYVHFGDAFRSAQRVGQSAAAAPAAGSEAETPTGTAGPAPAAGTSRPERLLRALQLARAAWGLPLIALAAAGLWSMGVRERRDRLSLLVCASALVCVAVTTIAVLAPVEPRFERYTDEFISRLYYAVTPAVAVAAARAVAWSWSQAATGRGLALVAMALTLSVGFQSWLGWIR